MKRANQDALLIDLDGVLYRLRKRRGERPAELGKISGNKWLISDFGGTIPRVMAVEAPPKYAELLLFRRLREQGELDEQGHILTHWKRKKGQNGAELFFTAVDGAPFAACADRSEEDDAHHLLFSLHSLLLTALQHFGGGHTTAVLFEHGRHVDILLGRGGKVLDTTRVSSYAADEEARHGLGESARGELQTMAATAHVKVERIVYFNWMVTQDTGTVSASSFGSSDTQKPSTTTSTGWGSSSANAESQALERRIGAEWVRTLARALEAECDILKVERIQLEEDEVLLSSAPSVIRHLEVKLSASPPGAQLLYRLHRHAPTFTLLLWLAVVAFFAGGLWLQHETEGMRAEARMLSAEMSSDARKLMEVDPQQVSALKLARELERLRTLPSYREIIADLSSAGSGGALRLDKVHLEYPDGQPPLVNLDGRIDTSFNQANVTHKEFLTALNGLGYEVLKSDFTTDVQTLSFHLEMRRSGL